LRRRDWEKETSEVFVNHSQRYLALLKNCAQGLHGISGKCGIGKAVRRLGGKNISQNGPCSVNKRGGNAREKEALRGQNGDAETFTA